MLAKGYIASIVGSYKSKKPLKSCKKPSDMLANDWITNRRPARIYTKQFKQKVQKHGNETS